jgi:1-pyrroline-5-carboxylate dehydrogenase
VTPFNFTAIAGNLVSSPAIVGNVVCWKPSHSAMLSGHVLMQIYKEAGVPDGVVNFIPGDSSLITELLVNNPHFSGIHYTGSTGVFNSIYQKIAGNLNKYKTYPRIVGETGGKNYVFAHNSANVQALAVALIRGAFEYAGQKCSAASRAYIPASIWPKLKSILLDSLKKVETGNPENPSTLVNAVIHERSADKTAQYLRAAKDSPECEIIAGGTVDKSRGWFVSPTIVVTKNPHHVLMKDELFSPVLTIHVYEDAKFEQTLAIAESSVEYGLTGSFFATDRAVIEYADRKLVDSSGNFYINDKPTGAVVGQQPFGGARLSGTNDKAGSHLNLLRWTSVRSVKETFVPPTEVNYPYMNE